MADLSITASNVVPGSNALTEAGIAGEAITAGQAVYRSSTTGRWMLADADSATTEARKAKGLALNTAAVGQPLTVALSGSDVTLGSVLTAGTAYYLSGTAGGICPVADIGSGESVCLLGHAKSASVLALNIQYPGVTL